MANVERHAQQRIHAEQRGRTRAQGNERIHVGRAVQQRLHPNAEELEVNEDHGHQQHEQHQAVHHHVLHARKHARQRPAEHVAHGDVEQRHREHERDYQPTKHAFALGLGGSSWVGSSRGGSGASGTGTGSRTFARREGPVARLFHR